MLQLLFLCSQLIPFMNAVLLFRVPNSCRISPPLYGSGLNGSTLFHSITASLEDVGPNEQSIFFLTGSSSTSTELEALFTTESLTASLSATLSVFEITAANCTAEKNRSILYHTGFVPKLSAKQSKLLEWCEIIAKAIKNRNLNST